MGCASFQRISASDGPSMRVSSGSSRRPVADARRRCTSSGTSPSSDEPATSISSPVSVSQATATRGAGSRARANAACSACADVLCTLGSTHSASASSRSARARASGWSARAIATTVEVPSGTVANSRGSGPAGRGATAKSGAPSRRPAMRSGNGGGVIRTCTAGQRARNRRITSGSSTSVARCDSATVTWPSRVPRSWSIASTACRSCASTVRARGSSASP